MNFSSSKKKSIKKEEEKRRIFSSSRFSLFFDSDKSTTALLRLVFSGKQIFINENGVVANTEKTLNRGVRLCS